MLGTRRASTQDISLGQWLASWENYNASILVGLECSSYSQIGFAAAQDNSYLERLRLARTGSNKHMVERDYSMTRAMPKESIFVSLVQGSQSFFYQDNGYNLLQPGELAIYRADEPCLLGFSEPMRQFVFDIPQDDFAECCLRDFKGPLRIDVEGPVRRLPVRTPDERTWDFLNSPRSEGTERYREEAYDLLASIISDCVGEHRTSALGMPYLLVIRRYIQQRLDESALSYERVAAATSIFSWHLAQLFARGGNSPGRHPQGRCLERARQLLASLQDRRLNVTEVAYRHDFFSQTHSARVFKARYRVTPNEMRGCQTRLPYFSSSYCQGSVP